MAQADIPTVAISVRFREYSGPDFHQPARPLAQSGHIANHGNIQIRKATTESVLHPETLIDLTLALNGVTDPMSPKTPLKSDDPAQPKRFIKDAREAEADESDGTVKREFDKFIRGPRPKGPSPKQKNSR